MIYRVITRTPFSTGQCEGDLICEDDFSHKTLMVLLEKGKIAPVSSPPLSVIPGWTVVAGKVRDIGIVNAVEFIEADSVEIMHALDWKREATVARWKDKALALLIADSPLPRPRRKG